MEDVEQCLAAAAADPDLRIIRLKNRLRPSYDARYTAGYRCVPYAGLTRLTTTCDTQSGICPLHSHKAVRWSHARTVLSRCVVSCCVPHAGLTLCTVRGVTYAGLTRLTAQRVAHGLAYVPHKAGHTNVTHRLATHHVPNICAFQHAHARDTCGLCPMYPPPLLSHAPPPPPSPLHLPATLVAFVPFIPATGTNQSRWILPLALLPMRAAGFPMAPATLPMAPATQWLLLSDERLLILHCSSIVIPHA